MVSWFLTCDSTCSWNFLIIALLAKCDSKGLAGKHSPQDYGIILQSQTTNACRSRSKRRSKVLSLLENRNNTTFIYKYSRTPLIRPPSESHWCGRIRGMVAREGFVYEQKPLSVTRNVVVWEGWSLVRVVVRQGFYCIYNGQSDSQSFVFKFTWLWRCLCALFIVVAPSADQRNKFVELARIWWHHLPDTNMVWRHL